MTIDDEWKHFLSSDCNELNELYEESEKEKEKEKKKEQDEHNLLEPPKVTDIYISTKSKIAYLNQEIDLRRIFWNIPVIPYAKPCNGVIKKQMKFNSATQEELDLIAEHLKKEVFYEEQIITSINNPNGRIKFKDIRKISVGISKKDIMSYRCKKKSAFYNCFVMILRVKMQEQFKEIHVKVFNTGKLEIPGIQTDEIFETVLSHILLYLQPHVDATLQYLQKSDTILINSNFNCGFYINREALFDILKFKYNIQCIYDPCSYPGIQCKFYFNPQLKEQTGSQISQEDKISKKYDKIVEVSFMIFRTGSILIVGMCDEYVLYEIYEYLKNILRAEFHTIHQKTIVSENKVNKDKKKKIRRKIIQVTVEA